MIKPGAVLDIPRLGVRIEMRATAAETAGELLEFDVVGRARGLFAQEHVHTAQTERHEVIEGSMRLVLDGREHILGPGDAIEVPPGTPHRQLPGGDGSGRVRVRVRPAGRRRGLPRAHGDGEAQPLGLPAAARRRRDRARLRPTRATLRGRRCACSARCRRRSCAWPRASTCSSTSGTWRRRAESVFERDLRRPQLPAVVEARLRRRRRRAASRPSARSRASTSRAACRTTCTRARGSRGSSTRT